MFYAFSKNTAKRNGPVHVYIYNLQSATFLIMSSRSTFKSDDLFKKCILKIYEKN